MLLVPIKDYAKQHGLCVLKVKILANLGRVKIVEIRGLWYEDAK